MCGIRPWGGAANNRLYIHRKRSSPHFAPSGDPTKVPVFLRLPEIAGVLLFVAGSDFDERRRRALFFLVAVGSSADTAAFARSEGTGLVLLTIPFIGRKRGENSGTVWHAYSGHKLKLKKTPPAPGLSPGGGEVKGAHPLPGPLPAVPTRHFLLAQSPAGEGIVNGKPPLIRPFGTPSPTDGRRKIHTHPLPTSPLARGRGPQSLMQHHMGWPLPRGTSASAVGSPFMLLGQPCWFDIIFSSQAEIIPIGMCYIWEVEGNSSQIFKITAISVPGVRTYWTEQGH